MPKYTARHPLEIEKTLKLLQRAATKKRSIKKLRQIATLVLNLTRKKKKRVKQTTSKEPNPHMKIFEETTEEIFAQLEKQIQITNPAEYNIQIKNEPIESNEVPKSDVNPKEKETDSVPEKSVNPCRMILANHFKYLHDCRSKDGHCSIETRINKFMQNKPNPKKYKKRHKFQLPSTNLSTSIAPGKCLLCQEEMTSIHQEDKCQKNTKNHIYYALSVMYRW